MTTEQYFWHFARVANDGKPRLGYDDGREIVVGETLTVEGTPIHCEDAPRAHGLHASSAVWDALSFVSGDKIMLCRVTLGGTVIHKDTKSVANERTCIAMLDAEATEKLLRDFARWCALQVIHLWDAPDVVKQYLETGDESLRVAARDAAWYAAWYTAWSAAWYVARDTAWYAARDEAGNAAWYAARYAKIEKHAEELERRGLAAIDGLAQAAGDEVTP